MRYSIYILVQTRRYVAEDIFGIKRYMKRNLMALKTGISIIIRIWSRADEFEGNVQGEGVNTFLEITITKFA